MAFLITNSKSIWGFFDSSFTSALLGAGFGAWGAQRIAERSKGREQLLTEMKATNAARSLVFQIVNSMIATKSQQIRPMKLLFEQQKYTYASLIIDIKLGLRPPDSRYTPRVDLRSIAEISLPIEPLQKYLYEKINSSGKALALIGTITESLASINLMLTQRRELIESFKTDDMYKKYQAQVYFGIHIPDEYYQNTMYSDLLSGITDKVDDVIFFGLLLNEDLMKHGIKLERLFKKDYGKGAVSPIETSFESAERGKLIPHPIHYMDWLTNFIERPENKSLFSKLREYFKTKIRLGYST